MGYKARHPTANFFDYFFLFVSIKNPFALFIFFFRPTREEKKTKKKKATNTCTSFVPHHFYPFSFRLRRRFRPTGVS